MPVFRLYLPGILEYPDIYKKIARRLEASSKINVRPLTLVRGQQIAILPHILLFLGTEAARRSVAPRGMSAIGTAVRLTHLLSRQINNVGTVPNQLLELVCPGSVICKQASLVSSHGKVVHQQRAGDRLVRSRIKRTLEGLQEIGDILIQVSNLPRHGAHDLGLVRW